MPYGRPLLADASSPCFLNYALRDIPAPIYSTRRFCSDRRARRYKRLHERQETIRSRRWSVCLWRWEGSCTIAPLSSMSKVCWASCPKRTYQVPTNIMRSAGLAHPETALLVLMLSSSLEKRFPLGLICSSLLLTFPDVF